MHVGSIVQELLGSSIHNTRIKTISVLVEGIIRSKELKLTSLGRSIKIKGKECSAINRVDRALSNKFYQTQSIEIYRCIVDKALGKNKAPTLIVDWSSIPGSHLTASGEHCILRASLAAVGRSITLYEEVHPKSHEGRDKIHKHFLKNLKSLFPSDYRPCILTDAGFKNPWFKAVLALGWDYIGRLSGAVHFDDGTDFRPLAELFKQATHQPKAIGTASVAKTNPLITQVFIYKRRVKGRKHISKTGKVISNKQSRKHAKSNSEPWILTSSLTGTNIQERIIKMYKLRMTIEESFRDTKSQRYGFGLNENITINVQRYNTWIMLATLASFIAWVTGFSAEKKNLHFDFQANTYRFRRVLSFFFLGCQVIRKKIDIPICFDEIRRLNWGISL
jgi:hypothetical protein